MPTTSIKNAYCCTRKVSSKYIVEQNVMFIHYEVVPDWHSRDASSLQLRGELLSFA